VSAYAAREITKYLSVPADRLRVTLEGVSSVYRPSESVDDVRAAAARAGVPAGARWLMYVGGFGPHKHVPAIVRAHARVVQQSAANPPLLLLAGPQGAGFHEDLEAIRDTIRECGTEQLVKWVGYLPDEELRHLHTGAIALVLISAAEGFGLPAVEAARCGTPVIATTESPLPQILEGGGFFVSPGDWEATSAAVLRLLADESARRAMGEKALERASSLSWDRAARVALQALEEAGSVAEKLGSNAHVRT
jgi:glycosyltransferase involved in cell wall biosynthesis